MNIRDKITSLLASCTSGRLPSGYTELGWIKSSGTQWIDTGIYADLTKDFTVSGKAGFVTSGRGILLSGYGGDNINGLSIELFNQAGFVNCFRVYAGQTDIILINTGASLNTPFDFNATYTVSDYTFRVVANGKSGSKTSSTVVPSAGRYKNYVPLILGSDQSNPHRFPYGMFGEINIENPDLVADLIPAKRNSDNEIGMYDLVSNTFFTNAGTGSFIGGDPV